jgi:flavorubredoxin
MLTNANSGTCIDEIEDGIYRISTPLTVIPEGFIFNQYLIVDDEPLLFHTGLRRLFPVVREAISAVMPVERLRHISFSHYEADECGALNDFLAIAPNAVPLCGRIAAIVSIGDVADRAPRAMEGGEVISLG